MEIKRGKSYKERTSPAGNLVERIACPMCGWLRTLKYGVSEETGQPREVRFDKMDVENAPILRMEKLSGRGRASKQAVIELVSSKKLSELPEEYKEQIRIQCNRILENL
jgi:hypothetical protein